MSVGAHLRQLRETRGVSLEEIARTTRVSAHYLHALEADDFASLPVAVFTRGFIRAYCQALGEAPDAAVALYDGRSEPVPSVAAAPASAAPSRPAAVSGGTASPRLAAEHPGKNRGPVLVSFILLVVLGVALFAVTLALQSGREAPEDRRATRGPGTVERPVVAPPAAPGSPP
ncbi:MAG: helix-turn-helix domain-containing protein, partial [Candidatus Rokubacteria bacterium]|nr:helix-turn-helix domain-containing protein [Candidatus Rokubacteria bacterium]